MTLHLMEFAIRDSYLQGIDFLLGLLGQLLRALYFVQLSHFRVF